MKDVKRTLLLVCCLLLLWDKATSFVGHAFPSSPPSQRWSVSLTSASSSSDKNKNKNNNNNSKSLLQPLLQDFERDVTIVLKELRSSPADPTLPPPFHRNTDRPSFTKTWTRQDWDRHCSQWRYWDYLRFFPSSRLLERISPHMALLVAWSTFVAAFFSSSWGSTVLAKVSISLTPLSIVSSIVFALQTLRSNQGLSRLNEGRNAFGKVVLYTRDMAQLVAVAILPRNPHVGMLLARHVALYPWLLKLFLRRPAINGTDEDIIRTMLPNAKDADFVMGQRKPPVAVVMRLRQMIAYMGHKGQLSTAEELAMDHVAQELNHCITTAERIIASPIPVLYSAHLGRLLIFYLVLLPLALRGSNMLNGLATVLTTSAVGFAVLGLDEISHLLEQPFKYMPLYQLSKNSMRDVADTFVRPPPPPPEDEDASDDNADDQEDDSEQTGTTKKPNYWGW